MKEYLDEVKNEIRRIDHLLYVTLKYTRTVDIVKSIVERIITAFDRGFEGLLIQVAKKRKNFEVPPQPRKKCEVLKELYPEDKKLEKFIELYLLLRDVTQSKFSRMGDFRKNVTMIVHLKPEEDFHINMEKLHEYYEIIKNFVEYLKEKLG